MIQNLKPALPSINSGPEPVEASFVEVFKTCGEPCRTIENPKLLDDSAERAGTADKIIK
jgi:hypothetical protein